MGLVLAFVAGFAMTFFLNADDIFLELVNESVPTEMAAVFISNPWLIGVSSGIGFMGLLNIFLIVSLISVTNTAALFMIAILAFMVPEYAITL